jgi:hypothetical protein
MYFQCCGHALNRVQRRGVPAFFKIGRVWLVHPESSCQLGLSDTTPSSELAYSRSEYFCKSSFRHRRTP